MNTRVVGAGDGTWAEVLERVDDADVYFLPEYHRVYEANGDGTPLAFVAEHEDALLVHPFMLRPIEGEGLYDIESVNGYTGPLASNADPAFVARVWAAFHAWCVEQGVVAEFIRFHPLLGNEALADGETVVTRDRDVVVLRLGDDMWTEYPSVQRNMVRKALALGLEAGEDPDTWTAFESLYAAGMDRLGARESVRFREPYFAALRRDLGDRVRLFAVRDGEAVVAAAVFLAGERFLHYHLAASDPERRRSSGANNLLLHVAAEWGRERGLGWMHLGGGRTARPDDELLRFKASVSDERRGYHLGRRVHDEAGYAGLVARWERRSTLVSRPPYFFVYRLDPATGEVP